MMEEVKAEVIEPQREIVSFQAGTITADFAELNAKVDAILQDYDGWEPTASNADDVKQCAEQRKYLSSLVNDLESRRKSVKQQYLSPLNAFESEVKSVTGKITHVIERLKAVEKEADDFRRAEVYAELQEHYEAYAGLLVDVVDYGMLHDERWCNKTYGMRKAKAELENKVDSLASDWSTLKSMDVPEKAAAEARLFQTLDLGEALKWAQKLADDKARLEAMKAELEPAQENVEPEAAHEPPSMKPRIIAGIANQLEWYDEPRLERLSETMSNISEAGAKPMVMVIDALSVSQAQCIGAFCGMLGVSGRFMQGTLEEVSRRR